MKLLKNKEAPAEVIAHDVEPLTVNTDARAYARMGWIVVLIGVFGFLAWAMLAPLDKGVPMNGVVTKESNRKTVQYMNNGTVDDILVHDGDAVKAGQVLVRMNGVHAQAELGIVRNQYYTAMAAQTRLEAERDGKSVLTTPAELKANESEPTVAASLALQRQLLASRQQALQSELLAFDENIAGLKLQISGALEGRESKLQQMGFLKEQLANMRELAKDGYVARSRLLDVERSYAQLNGQMAEDVGSVGRSQRQVLEMNSRRAMRIQDYQKEVRTNLAQIEQDVGTLRNKLTALEYERDNVEVKSPVDGTVVGMNIFTRGGVIGGGFHMMDIVPTDDPLVVEGRLPIQLVDKVHPNLPVELIFSAFNSNSTPHIPGVVTTVSADRLTDERTGEPYYRLKARVTPEGQRLILSKKLDVRAGMPVELFVKTGERTMMSYLLKPVFDRAHSALKEE